MLEYDPQKLFWPLHEAKPRRTKMMPKIIHQMWLGGNPPMNLINTWIEKNPTWSHILWTEENLKNWRFHNQAKVDAMPEPNGKCDIMRYEILYHMGGFFVDVDTICLKPLPDELFQYDSLSVYEGEQQRGGLIACGFMASQPRCELMRLCIENIETVKSPAWWYVGPAYFTSIVQKYQYPIHICPSHYFIPKHYAGNMYQGSGHVYCDHLWGVTHPEGYERFKKIEPVKTESPATVSPVQQLKAQRRQLTLQDARSCRRMGILCHKSHRLRGRIQAGSSRPFGQQCSPERAVAESQA